MRSVRSIRHFLPLMALGVVMAGGPASATTATFEGFNPKDPIGSASRELWRLVRDKCFPGSDPVTVGTASLPVTELAFTKDQGHHLMNAVHSAFSALPGVKMAAFRDVGALVELKSVGLTGTAQAGSIEAELGKIDLVITASGQRFGSGVRFALTAKGRTKDCFEMTPPVDVPPEIAGEIFMSPDSLFAQAALALWEKARGHTKVVVGSRTVDGRPLDPQLPDYFTRMMRLAVTSTQQSANMSIGAQLEVINGGQAAGDDEVRWNADVVVEPRANGYRIVVDLTRPNDAALAYSGLVSPDDLPALRRVDLQWASKTGGGNVRQQATSGLRLSSVPTRIRDAVDDRNREQRYAFSLSRTSYVEVDLPQVDGPSHALPIDILAANNAAVKPTFTGRARPNLRRYTLPPGQYQIKVAAPGRATSEYTLRARAVETASMLEPEAPGRLTRRFQDWYVGELVRGGRKVCYVYTPAIDVAPSGWREQRPIIWLSVGADPNEPINHMLDDTQRYAKGRDFRAAFEGRGGPTKLDVRALEAHILPVVDGSSGEPVLDRNAIRAYTTGSVLELQGTTPDNRSSSVMYSLNGYRSAVNAMAMACGRSDLANDLIWR